MAQSGEAVSTSALSSPFELSPFFPSCEPAPTAAHSRTVCQRPPGGVIVLVPDVQRLPYMPAPREGVRRPRNGAKAVASDYSERITKINMLAVAAICVRDPSHRLIRDLALAGISVILHCANIGLVQRRGAERQ